MPVPKRKLSRARIRSRAANKGLKPNPFYLCKNCETPNLSHQVCETCGFYKGKKVLTTKMDRALVRGQAKQQQQKRMEAKAQETPGQEQ